MDREEDNHKDRNDQERMHGFFVGRLCGPGNQLFHFARRFEGCRCLKDDTDFAPVSVEGDNMIVERLV
jgi:hypothetical protein